MPWNHPTSHSSPSHPCTFPLPSHTCNTPSHLPSTPLTTIPHSTFLPTLPYPLGWMAWWMTDVPGDSSELTSDMIPSSLYQHHDSMWRRKWRWHSQPLLTCMPCAASLLLYSLHSGIQAHCTISGIFLVSFYIYRRTSSLIRLIFPFSLYFCRCCSISVVIVVRRRKAIFNYSAYVHRVLARI